MICHITDIVDDHFCGYLQHLLAVCTHGTEPNCCKLTLDNNNNNSGHFYRAVSHRQGSAHRALQINNNVYIKTLTTTIHIYMCVCVRACVRVCVRGGGGAGGGAGRQSP